VLSQGEQRDEAVNIDTYRSLQRHRAVSLQQHCFIVGLCLLIADNVGLLSKVSEEVDSEIAKKISSSTTPLSFDAHSLRKSREYPHIPYISRN